MQMPRWGGWGAARSLSGRILYLSGVKLANETEKKKKETKLYAGTS